MKWNSPEAAATLATSITTSIAIIFAVCVSQCECACMGLIRPELGVLTASTCDASSQVGWWPLFQNPGGGGEERVTMVAQFFFLVSLAVIMQSCAGLVSYPTKKKRSTLSLDGKLFKRAESRNKSDAHKWRLALQASDDKSP